MADGGDAHRHRPGVYTGRQRGRGAAASRAASAASPTPIIHHLSPRPDSVGGLPDTFQWTRIAGADSYELALWNDVDVLLWRQRQIADTRIARPKELTLEAGTYMWSVSAFRGDQPIAEAGLAAFVVRVGDLAARRRRIGQPQGGCIHGRRVLPIQHAEGVLVACLHAAQQVAVRRIAHQT